MLRRLALRWIYRYTDKAFYVGINNKAYFLAHGLSEQQLVYAPHAIDLARFADGSERMYKEKAMEWRRKLGYSPSDIVILFAGKFEPIKNPKLLIKIFNDFFKDESNLKLLMVGNGVLEDELKTD